MNKGKGEHLNQDQSTNNYCTLTMSQGLALGDGRMIDMRKNRVSVLKEFSW